MGGGGSLQSEDGGFEGEWAALGVKTATMMVSAAAIFSEKTTSRVRATEQSLHSENKDRAIRFFSFAFGGSIPMTLQNKLLSLPDIHTYTPYSQKGFRQEDFNSTGTLSKAEQACQWGDRNSHFIQRIE